MTTPYPTPEAINFEPIASRPPPRAARGLAAWLRSNLFDGWRNTLATLVVLALLALVLPHLLQWALVNAVFTALVWIEGQFMAAGIALPFGSSVFVVARRRA